MGLAVESKARLSPMGVPFLSWCPGFVVGLKANRREKPAILGSPRYFEAPPRTNAMMQARRLDCHPETDPAASRSALLGTKRPYQLYTSWRGAECLVNRDDSLKPCFSMAMSTQALQLKDPSLSRKSPKMTYTQVDHAHPCVASK